MNNNDDYNPNFSIVNMQATTRLHELTREANSLQEENEWLRLANEDLISRLNRLLASSVQQQQVVGRNSHNIDNIVGSNSPTSVINDHDERFAMPKSISIRSPTYFKFVNSSPSTPTSISTPLVAESTPLLRPFQNVNGTRLRMRRDEEKAMEMEVYNQGMYKTELCNKWEETSTCPYGQHCRFAHGLSELRPIIRHPRYKTQVCRMVLTGVQCPYGHRCHFRHSL
ncbi:zinc finger CCCH domain-containing protein 15-like [Silene latifolia]|uniref:zinc finger CCCH domain-containing protein 15-like n=1 Tax=Silene latifolia TaxID=37657 RepID=UPI003D770524